MNTLYLDLFSGISGDMFLGALIDLGVDPHRLEHELEKLPVHGYHVHACRAKKCGIEGVKFDVHAEDHHHEHEHLHPHEHRHDREQAHEHEHPHHHEEPAHEHDEERTFKQIERLIRGSALSDWVKDKAISVFRRIAVAEGKIHGQPPEQVHFHEVGAVDSIVDIVGACIALELLGNPRVLASPVVDGAGWVDCAHGRFPVPAPAVLEILGGRGIAVTQCEEPHELVTPTGAALLAEFAVTFGPMSGLVATRIGYGLGTRDNKTRPNVLRAVLGESALHTPHSALDWESDTIAVLETNLDDINAELLGHFVEKALADGALDVFHTPIQMKKNRPAALLTVLCAEAEADRFSEMILRETTAFGVRRTLAERRKLPREFAAVTTAYGEIQIKLGRLGGRVVQSAPEYESCRAAAARAGVPLKQVFEAAQAAAEKLRAATPHTS
jgi:uncharacterized protein (TIGR00299 family) protein